MSVDFSIYRANDIENNLEKMQVQPLDVMITGVTGAGKSTTLNAFFQKIVAEVGDGVDPQTKDLDSYALSDSFRLWDTPGLGDGVANDRKHKKKMINLLYSVYTLNDIKYGFIDMAIIVIEGSNKDMGTTYTLLNEVIVPNIQKDRILVIINKADMAMKGRHWDNATKTPDAELLNFLENQAISIQRRVHEATGIGIMRPVYYSAEYGWNVRAVFDFIIDNMPFQRREIIK